MTASTAIKESQQAERKQLSPFQITSVIGQGVATLMHHALAASLDVASPGTAKAEDLFDRIFSSRLLPGPQTRQHKSLPWRNEGSIASSFSASGPADGGADKQTCLPLFGDLRRAWTEALFLRIYGGDSSAKKPDPEGLLAIIQEANAHFSQRFSDCRESLPESIVMIGDSDVDM